jgi:hypothetical protein
LKPVGFGYAKSLVGEFAEAESSACSAPLAGVISIIECPDQFPAIGLKDLLQLLTTVIGPSATSQGDPSKSADEGRPVVLCADEQGRI